MADIAQCYGVGCVQRDKCYRYTPLGYSSMLKGTYLPTNSSWVVYDGQQVCTKLWEKNKGER